jgi:phosphatidylglycerophosphate synthase
MAQKKSLERIQRSWLAANERRLLVWMATHMPAWVKPDHLTGLGLTGSLMCGAGFACSNFSPAWLWLCVLGLVINWAGDSTDGSLARVRKIERPQYGFFVDHTSDILSQGFIFIGLALSPYVRFETGCLLLMSYWIAAMFTFIRAITGGVFQISYYGIGPTEIRIGLLVYVASLLTIGPMTMVTRMGELALMDMIAIVIFCVVFVSFGIMTIWEARRLASVDVAPVVAPALAHRSLPSGGSLLLAETDRA